MNLSVIPQFINLTKRPCLMLGENQEAITKGEILLNAGAELSVISNKKHLWPQELADQINWLPALFKAEYLESIWLVICVLEVKKINSAFFAAFVERQIC
ncbi:MAG: hypothetical protein HQL68_09015, partial [Magnetococcales bacterium]|nr:hypothetical protein [Magnetococcales bacterium]